VKKSLIVLAVLLALTGAAEAKVTVARRGFVRLIAFDPRDGQWHRARLFDTASECHAARMDLEDTLARTSGVDAGRYRKYFDCVPE
jgi:hypothetical protein